MQVIRCITESTIRGVQLRKQPPNQCTTLTQLAAEVEHRWIRLMYQVVTAADHGSPV